MKSIDHCPKEQQHLNFLMKGALCNTMNKQKKWKKKLIKIFNIHINVLVRVPVAHNAPAKTEEAGAGRGLHNRT